MAAIRETKTQQKHADIYEEYERVLKKYNGYEQGHAVNVARKVIWSEVAEKCRCSEDHVRRIVNRILKKIG